MLAATLIAAALLGSPFTPRAIVPVTTPVLSVSATPSAFNPDATTRASSAAIEIVPVVAGTLSVNIVTEDGLLIASLVNATSVSAGSNTRLSWDGGGLSDGTYGIQATLVDTSAAVSQSLTPITVDTEAPKMTLATPRPELTKVGPVAIKVAGSDLTGLSRVTLTVQNQLDDALGTIAVPIDASGQSASLGWDLRLRHRLLLPGVYHLRVSGVDGVGNIGTTSVRILRVDRPVRNQIIYSLREAGQVIGLAFDDCVSEQAWLSIIKAFRAAKANTTFFCNGVNVRSNPTAARAALAAGDTVGSHTWAHPRMPMLSAAEQASQIRGDKEIWWQVAKAAPMPFFRPPYGLHNATTDAAAGTEGFAYSVLWDVDPSDYLDPPPAVLVDKVTSHARAGSIVVMHVNTNTASAVPSLIAALRRDGLEPESLDEMFGTAAYLEPRHG